MRFAAWKVRVQLTSDDPEIKAPLGPVTVYMCDEHSEMFKGAREPMWITENPRPCCRCEAVEKARASWGGS